MHYLISIKPIALFVSVGPASPMLSRARRWELICNNYNNGDHHSWFFQKRSDISTKHDTLLNIKHIALYGSDLSHSSVKMIIGRM